MAKPSPRQTLPRSARLRSRKAFARVFGGRCRVSDRWITLFAASSDVNLARLGISVGRRFGSAVQRNRAKRRLREAFRRIRTELPPDDYVVLPRRSVEPTEAVLVRSLRTLTRRIQPKLRQAVGTVADDGPRTSDAHPPSRAPACPE